MSTADIVTYVLNSFMQNLQIFTSHNLSLEYENGLKGLQI